MGSRVYYTEIDGQKIYFLLKVIDGHYELSLYKDNKLVRRTSVKKGTHILSHENIVLHVYVSTFKLKVQLKIDGEVVEFKKMRRKTVRAILSEAHIYNDVNLENVPDEPLTIKSLGMPFLLVVVGFLLVYYLTGSKFASLVATLLYCIAISLVLTEIRTRRPFKNLEEPWTKLINLLHWIIVTFGAILMSEYINKII